MPVCPPRSAENRARDRWEYVVGKALKDYVTVVMASRRGLSRAEARKIVLQEIIEKTAAILRGSL